MKGKVTLSAPGPRYLALIELLRTAESLWNASRVFFARWDLSPSQFNVLNLLFDLREGCSQIELSRRLIMHRSNVTGLVDRLEARGLLERRANPTDRRAFNVALTHAGRKLIQQINPHYYAAAETVWEQMPVERANALVAELAGISARAGEIATSAPRSTARRQKK